MKRLWITGYGGFVGSHTARLAGPEWDVVGIARRAVTPVNDRVRPVNVDLCDGPAVDALFREEPPDAVIHAAAFADIEFCDANRSAADALNVGAVRRIADRCAESGARLVHCSTDTVFDGSKGDYIETDAPNPINYYGETKARAEDVVTESGAAALIARITLVVGCTVDGGGTTFFPKFLRNAEAGQPTAFPRNEVRTPVDVVTLASALVELAGRDETGILHLAGSTRLDRYEMGLRLAAKMGLPEDLITAADSNAMPGRVPRPADVSLNNAKARAVLLTPLPELEDALALVLAARPGGA